MTNLTRRIIIIIVGLLGALFAWPLIEACINLQTFFPSYFLYTLCSGVLTGAAMGAFFASAEGLLAAAPGKAVQGALSGVISGVLGGVAGAFVAQALLFGAGENLTQAGGEQVAVGLLVARAAGWAIIGAFIGMSEGIRARSLKKLLLGLLGGVVGGFLGGLLFVWVSAAHPSFFLGRLAALLIMGGLIALLYSLLEKRFAQGSLKVLNGPAKGKEFLINQRKLTLGSAGRTDIVLKGYRDISVVHAAIRIEHGEVVLLSRGGKVLVNEVVAEKVNLKLDDVIQIGSAKILYGYFG